MVVFFNNSFKLIWNCCHAALLFCIIRKCISISQLMQWWIKVFGYCYYKHSYNMPSILGSDGQQLTWIQIRTTVLQWIVSILVNKRGPPRSTAAHFRSAPAFHCPLPKMTCQVYFSTRSWLIRINLHTADGTGRKSDTRIVQRNSRIFKIKRHQWALICT